MARWQRRRSSAGEGTEGDSLAAPRPEEGAQAGPPVHVTVDEPGAPLAPGPDEKRSRVKTSILDAAPFTLFLASHPRQAFLTAFGVAATAALAARPTREVAVVLVTVLVGQTILGWHNDIVDRERDAEHDIAHKPVAQGRLDVGTAWFALVVAVLMVVPLSISTGILAGAYYLASLVVGVLGNVVLRRGRLSFLPWAASYALLPAYLSYGGWGGDAIGDPPEVLMIVLAAMLGVGVHFLRAIWGLVPDDADGWTYLPLTLGRRLGATRLLVLSATYTGLVIVALAVAGSIGGLRR